MAAAPGHRSPFFVASLSPGELLALRQTGAEPLGQVMGCSVYAITAPMSSAVSGELKTLTGALQQMQHLALGRLRAEAEQIGADGVVSVSFQVHHKGTPSAPFRELRVTGTAIRAPGAAPTGRHASPWLSGLSGVEYAQLRQAGYRPVGLVLGNCAYLRLAASLRLGSAQRAALYYGLPVSRSGSANAAAPNSSADWLLTYSSYERKELSEAVYKARHLAMERLESEARAGGADGIVGVHVDVERHVVSGDDTQPGLFVHFFAAGTAVASGGRGGSYAASPAPTALTLSLRD